VEENLGSRIQPSIIDIVNVAYQYGLKRQADDSARGWKMLLQTHRYVAPQFRLHRKKKVGIIKRNDRHQRRHSQNNNVETISMKLKKAAPFFLQQ
jgi:hypothetical protein